MVKLNNKSGKSISFFLVVLSLFLAISTTACSNFMEGGDLLENLEKVVEEAVAPVVQVTVNVENPEHGTTVPSSPAEFKLNKEYEIQYKPTSKFMFIEWKVACPTDSTVDWSTAIKLEGVNSAVAKITFLKELPAITITPVVVPKLACRNYVPLEDGRENPKDSTITVTFEQELSAANDLSKIQIISQGESVTEYFNTPSISGNVLTITAKKEHLIDVEKDKTRNITVVIPENFYYKKGDALVPMGSEIRWTYKINSTTDSKTEVTCSSLAAQGTINPTELKKYNIGESFDLTFTPKDYVIFKKWLVKDGEGHDVPDTVLHFETPDATTTKVTVLAEMKGITIRPSTVLLPAVLSVTPEFSYSGAPWDSDIVITFNKPVDLSSFWKNVPETNDVGMVMQHYTYYYSIEDRGNGTLYHGDEFGNSSPYNLPVLSEDLTVLTIPSTRMEFGTLTNNFLSSNSTGTTVDIVIKLAGKIKDTEGIELSQTYPDGYEYETRLTDTRCKSKVVFKDLKICNGKYVNIGDFFANTNPYTLKDNPVFFKVYQKQKMINANTGKSEGESNPYGGENPLLCMENNLIMRGKVTYIEEIDGHNYTYAVVSTESDPRLPLILDVYSQKAVNDQNDIPSIHDLGYEDIDSDGPLSNNMRKQTIDSFWGEIQDGIQRDFLPNADNQVVKLDDEILFDGDGIYRLVFKVRDSAGAESTPYFESFVIYKKDLLSALPDLNIKYNGENLSYNSDVSMSVGKVKKSIISQNPDNIKEYVSNLPFEVKIEAHELNTEMKRVVISNSWQTMVFEINELIPPAQEVLFSKQSGSNTEFILKDSDVILINRFPESFPSLSIKYALSTDLNATIYDKVTIPTAQLTNNQKVKIYPVAEYSKQNKKTYFYGEPYEFTYKTPTVMQKPVLGTQTITKGGYLGYCEVSVPVENFSDYSQNVSFYSCWNTEDTIPADIDFRELHVEPNENGVMSAKVLVPCNKTGYYFVYVTDGYAGEFSESGAFDTTDDALDTISPFLCEVGDDSSISRDVLGQLMIPVEDNVGLDFSERFEYGWEDNGNTFSTTMLKGVITKRDNDDKKGFLHVNRRSKPENGFNDVETFNTKYLSVSLISDTSGNPLSGIIANTVSSYAVQGNIEFDKDSNSDGFIVTYDISPETTNYKLVYAKFDSNGTIDLENIEEIAYSFDNNYNVPMNESGSFICVNIDVPGLSCKPLFMHVGNSECSLKHVYTDSDRTSLFLSGGKALVLVYAIPFSEAPAYIDPPDGSSDYAIQQALNDWEYDVKNKTIEEGTIIQSKIYNSSATLTIDDENLPPSHWIYVYRVIFSDNTEQSSHYYYKY